MRVRTLLLLVLLLAPSACSHPEIRAEQASASPPPTGVPFSLHFISYASTDDTQTVLRARDYEWKSLPNELVTERAPSMGKDQNTTDARAFVISTLEIDDYIHLGFHGKAVLIFSNDRLMLFEFFPHRPAKNLKAYEASAKDYDRTMIEADSQAGSCLNCRVFASMQSKQAGAGFVWADRRLVSEIPRFSGELQTGLASPGADTSQQSE